MIGKLNFQSIRIGLRKNEPNQKQIFFSGAKWEWSSSALTGSTGSNTSNSEWHIYDMEVQTVIEESWAMGEQTIDIGQHFPGCPYIINFCNLTQVRRTTGVVRPIRRQPCASYPMVSAIHSATGNQRFCFQSKKVTNDVKSYILGFNNNFLHITNTIVIQTKS